MDIATVCMYMVQCYSCTAFLNTAKVDDFDSVAIANHFWNSHFLATHFSLFSQLSLTLMH